MPPPPQAFHPPTASTSHDLGFRVPSRTGTKRESPGSVFTIEILLPLRDNDGQPFARAEFDSVRQELAERFGGVTAFMRSPAVGVWKDDDGVPHHDEIVVFEVMAETVDQVWWRSYRMRLEERFRQDEIVVRATNCRRL